LLERLEHELHADQELREAVVQVVPDSSALALAAGNDLPLEPNSLGDVAHRGHDLVLAALDEPGLEVALRAVDVARVLPALDGAGGERAQPMIFVQTSELRAEDVAHLTTDEFRRRARQVTRKLGVGVMQVEITPVAMDPDDKVGIRVEQRAEAPFGL